MADEFQIAPAVDSLDGVPQALHGFYKQGSDGKFALRDPSSIDKLENTVTALRGELTTAKQKADAVRAWEKLGKSPEEIETLLKTHATEEEQRAAQRGEFDKLRKQIEDNHGKEKSTWEQREKALRSALESELIDAKATSAIAAAKGVPELLLPHVKSRVSVVEEDGKFSPVVLSDDGKTPRLNSENKPMTIAELVAEMRENATFGRAFEGSSHSGGGSGGGGGSGAPTGKSKAQMTIQEKTAYIREHGPEAYQKLAW